MAVYDLSGNDLNTIYNIDSNILSYAYNKNGTQIYPLDDLVQGRALIWHDEFDGSSLNLNKWNKYYGLSANNTIYPLDNSQVVNVANGLLDFRSIKNYPYSNADYTSAYIHTRDRFEFRYGLIEAKIKFSSESVYHATLWTLGANSYRLCKGEDVAWDGSVGMNFPSCGEIDIAEAWNNTKVTSVTHWATAKDGTTTQSSTERTATNDPDEWHIYGCEWTDTTITFYCDRVSKGSWTISNATVNGYNPFILSHYLIFNCIPQLNNTATGNDIKHYCDWIRVYAPAGETLTEETSISLNAQTMSLSVNGIDFLTPTFTPSYVSDMTVLWHSSNENVCTCYGGKIIAKGTGTATVTATSKKGYVATCTVTVS